MHGMLGLLAGNLEVKLVIGTEFWCGQILFSRFESFLDDLGGV